MKYLIVFVAILQLPVLYRYQQSNSGHTLIVERYRTSDYAFGGLISTEITEKRKYSNELVPLFKVEYHGKQLFDSTVYINQDHKIVKLIKFNNIYGLQEREDINYLYQKNGKIDVKVIKSAFSNSNKQDYINYLPQTNAYGFKDSLGLLEDDFSEFEIDHAKKLKKIYLQEGSRKIIMQPYIINSRAQCLFTYGVPHDADLKRINLFFTEDKMLVKDEFIFDRFLVRREYSYISERIKTIKVTKFKNHKIISTDTISFKYILS
ncbi:MAG: hypothetical protein ACXVJN_18635 [Mucilaginibacter sp.]